MGVFSFFSELFSSKKSEPADYLIVGLGNIGEEYEATRHNIGFKVADAIIASMSSIKEGRIPEADFFRGFINSKSVVIAKPRTLMNRSGAAVNKLINRFNVKISSTLILVDDFNIPIGKIRLRKNGSDGGHNGLKSIVSYIGSDFPRLRIGIGPLPAQTDVVEFVLGKFSTEEESALKSVIGKASEASIQFTNTELDVLMNKFNK